MTHRTVLMIEDEDVIVKIVERTIREVAPDCWKLISQNDLNRAVGVASLADVVLLDLHLPSSSGIDTLRRAKTIFQVPIVVLTGEQRDDDFGLQCLQSGASDYLAKSDVLPAKGALLTIMEKALVRNQLNGYSQELVDRADKHIKDLQELNVRADSLLAHVRQH